MLSEISIGGIYVPPFFLYALVSMPIYGVVRSLMARSGLLRCVWHPALFEFAVSLILVSVLLIYV